MPLYGPACSKVAAAAAASVQEYQPAARGAAALKQQVQRTGAGAQEL
jgi:hypothetical protein